MPTFHRKMQPFLDETEAEISVRLWRVGIVWGELRVVSAPVSSHILTSSDFHWRRPSSPIPIMCYSWKAESASASPTTPPSLHPPSKRPTNPESHVWMGTEGLPIITSLPPYTTPSDRPLTSHTCLVITGFQADGGKLPSIRTSSFYHQLEKPDVGKEG